MTDKRWKRAERLVATLLGSHRNPNNGYAQADIDTPMFAAEHKCRKALPGWLRTAMTQAARGATAGRTPIVVITAVSQGRKAERYVVMRFQDFVDWHGDPAEGAFE